LAARPDLFELDAAAAPVVPFKEQSLLGKIAGPAAAAGMAANPSPNNKHAEAADSKAASNSQSAAAVDVAGPAASGADAKDEYDFM